MAFLFVWQFVLSGPLEIASGYIGFASYAGYIWTGLTRAGCIALVTVGRRGQHRAAVPAHHVDREDHRLALGRHADHRARGDRHRRDALRPRVAFDFPPGAFNFSLGFFLGLGAASRIGIYDYLGYYDVCYIGDEVKDPGRVIPRSILISTVAVAAIYIAINLSIIGVVPWREFVPAADAPRIEASSCRCSWRGSTARASRRLHAAGAVDGVRLGASRCCSATRAFRTRRRTSGYFFEPFGRLHPTKDFPYVSLLVLGAISIVAASSRSAR